MTEGPAELDRILDALCTGGVRFIVVGGLAAVLQGAPVVTRAIDALGTLDGDDYEALLPDADVVPWGDHELAVLGLARLIEIKRRVARPKDLRMLPELEATLARIGAAKT
jgi:hypothetical protein